MKHANKKSTRRTLHKDWRTWAVISLMLAAMGIYVLTLDESVQPVGAFPNAPPAAANSGAAPR